jgi:hypothetical protein
VAAEELGASADRQTAVVATEELGRPRPSLQRSLAVLD